MTIPRTVLLASVENPLTSYFVEDMLDAGVEIEGLILDTKPETKRDVRLHQERTGGALPWRPLSVFADRRVACYFVSSHNAPACVDLLKSLDVAWMANVGTPRILSGEVLSCPHRGTLNCHPGRLPEFRGASAIEWAIYHDQPICNTVHLMSEQLDAGSVYRVEPIPVSKGDGYQDIRVRVYRMAFRLLSKTLLDIQRGAVSLDDFTPQEGGHTCRPIDDERMQAVLLKLERGEYATDGGQP